MIVGAFVSKFARILFQMGKEEVGQLLGVPSEIERLSRMVCRIQSVLVDAERRQMESAAINRWVIELKDVMYDADDIIDLFQIKAKKRRVESSSSFSSDASWWSHVIGGVKNPVFAHEISTKIKALDSRINEIMRDLPLLSLIENLEPPSYSQRRAFDLCRKTSSIVVLPDLVGEKIEEDTDQLVELITKDVDQGQGNIPIVAIEGMGGIGKTTLAKKVYNDPRIKEDFKHRIWVCVSKEIKPVDVLKNVIREVGGGVGASEEISELMPWLEKCIWRKKFLLVLDDVWPESEGVWYGLLRDPMIKGAPRSRVMITTRDGRVAMRMRTIHTLKVKRLSDEAGWSLLTKQVAPNEGESEIEDLKDIGMQIVKKCDGLPLAIKSIGGVLCTKDNTSGNWQDVLRSNVWSMDGLSGDIHHAFHLSYEDLSLPLKQCFIFCSLYPEDFVFVKTELIYLWLAEGFFQDNTNFWELGNEYYMELLQRNLLEVTGTTIDHEQCKMHDLLWSFGRHLGKDENCILQEGQVLSRSEGSLKVRRLSIEGNYINTELIKKEKGLRTLLIRLQPKIELDDLCKAFPNLRILDLTSSNFSSLPNSLCGLVHLRFLDVTGSKITNLPNSIGNLKYLLCLSLANCKNLSHIPSSIINLQELIVLSTFNSGVKAIPAGLNKLDKLITLCGLMPDKNSLEGFSSLDMLETLSQLMKLHLFNLEIVSDKNIAKRANLQNKDRLQEVKYFYTSLSWKDQVSQTNEKKVTINDVLNELCPPRSLEFLKIVNYFGRYLPNWLNLGVSLPNLRFIQITNCACFVGLAPFGQLPNLDYLGIIGAYSIVTVGLEFLWESVQSRDIITTSCHAKSAFPKLSHLEFCRMHNWKEWEWNKGKSAMPKLKKLLIGACPQLRSLPEGLLHHATSLECLKINGADKLITIENFPSVKEIHVKKNPNLVRISNMPNISYVEIYDCPNLKALQYLQALHTMDLVDYEMETLPEYLTTTMPKKLTIKCSEKLLLKIARQGESDSERNKFKHIPKVKICTKDKSLYATYQKTPFSFTTNIVSTRSV